MDTTPRFDRHTLSRLRSAQQNEITEYHIYTTLARWSADGKTKKILTTIANQEKLHYDRLEKITETHIPPSRVKIAVYVTISRLFGLSFGLRLMEQGEKLAQSVYKTLPSKTAIANLADEQRHEKELIGLIDDKLLAYTSSFVLGLNDALVELTGALAGLTLALSNTKLIAMVSLITGLAASFSMGASSYLSQKEEHGKHPVRFGLVTAGAYVVTVAFLVFPYFLFVDAHRALGTTITIAVVIIAVFTFYTSVAKGKSFRNKFLEMAAISLGLAAVNFAIGFFVKRSFGID